MFTSKKNKILIMPLLMFLVAPQLKASISNTSSYNTLAPRSIHSKDKKLPFEQNTEVSNHYINNRKNSRSKLLKKQGYKQTEFDNFYNNVLTPLLKITKVDKNNINIKAWNKKTWEAYQAYAKNLEWGPTMFNIDKIIEKIMSNHPKANEKTLTLLIKCNIMLKRVRDTLNKIEDDPESIKQKSNLMKAIHETGFLGPALRRVNNPIDPLLPVGKNSSLPSDGFVFFQDKKIDILTKKARKKYEQRHSPSNTRSIFKLYISDLNLSTNEQFAAIQTYFAQTASKNITNPSNRIIIDNNSNSIKQALEVYKNKENKKTAKEAGEIQIFNGMVQSWNDLMAEADNAFTTEKAQLNQIEWLFSKQMEALASSFIIFNTEKIFNKDLTDNNMQKVRISKNETINPIIDLLWRIAHYELDFNDPFIKNSFFMIPETQLKKHYSIWRTIVEKFHLQLTRLDKNFVNKMTRNGKEKDGIWFPKENHINKKDQYSSDYHELYMQLKSQGYHFEGVVTSSGLGIDAHDIDLAKDALRQAWKKLPEKTIIVVGATGNDELGNLSGVDLAYKVAEEMGFKTMGIMSQNGFDFPLWKVDYLISHGKDWGDESDILFQFANAMTAFTGGNQALNELKKYIDLYQEKSNIKLIRGIKSFKENKNGSKTGSIDSPDILNLVDSLPESQKAIIDSYILKFLTLEITNKNINFSS